MIQSRRGFGLRRATSWKLNKGLSSALPQVSFGIFVGWGLWRQPSRVTVEKKFIVRLTQAERETLEDVVKKLKGSSQ